MSAGLARFGTALRLTNNILCQQPLKRSSLNSCFCSGVASCITLLIFVEVGCGRVQFHVPLPRSSRFPGPIAAAMKGLQNELLSVNAIYGYIHGFFNCMYLCTIPCIT